jgi:hypothetical protein
MCYILIEPPLLDHQTLHHSEWPNGPQVSAIAVMNNCADADGGGGDRCNLAVVAAVNSLGKEKPRPNQSTIFLSSEGS